MSVSVFAERRELSAREISFQPVIHSAGHLTFRLTDDRLKADPT